MYTDPSFIREHVVKLRLNDEELELVNDLARRSGKKLATLAHDLILERVRALVADAEPGAGKPK